MTLSVISRHKAKIVPLIFVVLFTISWMAQTEQPYLEIVDAVIPTTDINTSDDLLVSPSDNDRSVEAFNSVDGKTSATNEDFPEYQDDQDLDVTLVLNSSKYNVGQTVAVNITSTATSWLSLNGTLVWTLTDPKGEEVFQSNVTVFKALNTTLVDNNVTERHELYHAGFNNYSTWNSQNLTSSLHFNSTTIQNVTYFASNGTKIVTNTTYPGYMNFTIELPLYPAVLGTWRFRLFLNNTGADGYNLRQRWYDAEFRVIEPIIYKLRNTHVVRGVHLDNETVKPYFANETGIQEYFSPGDNITYIGQFFYNSTPGTPINTSLLSLTTEVKFVYQDREWTSIGYLRYYSNETASIAQGNMTAPYYNNTNFTAFNFKIPLENIYGNLSATITFTFEYSEYGAKHSETVTLDPIKVRYRVKVESESVPDENTFYITQRVNGSITVLTTKWNETLETFYSANNYSADFLIPTEDLNVSIYQYLNTDTGNELQMFEVTNLNYTFYWDSVVTIDPGQTLGDYTLKLRWQTPESLNENTSVESINTGLEYSYEFTITRGTLVVVDLTSDINFTRGNASNIYFQVKISETGKILGHDMVLTAVSGTTEILAVYMTTLYRYEVTITPDEVGVFSFDIQLQDGTTIGSVSYEVVDPVKFTTSALPPPVVEAGILDVLSFTDILMLAGLVVVLVGFAIVVIKFLPR
ncbi:MAG: hypothetical protein ACXADA_09115 [Candidatus Hodarchaeales archaeon]